MKITIDGKEYECKKVVMNNDNVEIVLEEDGKKETGYERVDKDETYCYITNMGNVNNGIDQDDSVDNATYDNANYYSSKEIAKNNARADKLIRQLRRFSVENRKSKLDWINRENHKYRIAYNHLESMIRTGRSFGLESFGTIYFDSKELAEQAIKEFKNELIWYFTEYKDSL